MSPTVFRSRGYAFRFYSNEEARMHVHVERAGSEAKFWIEPEIELARNYGMTKRQLVVAFEIIRERADEIRSAWQRFRREDR